MFYLGCSRPKGWPTGTCSGLQSPASFTLRPYLSVLHSSQAWWISSPPQSPCMADSRPPPPFFHPPGPKPRNPKSPTSVCPAQPLASCIFICQIRTNWNQSSSVSYLQMCGFSHENNLGATPTPVPFVWYDSMSLRQTGDMFPSGLGSLEVPGSVPTSDQGYRTSWVMGSALSLSSYYSSFFVQHDPSLQAG